MTSVENITHSTLCYCGS